MITGGRMIASQVISVLVILMLGTAIHAQQGGEKPPEPVWTLDLQSMRIPDRPAAGVVAGRPFRLDSATLEGGVLTLRQGADFFADQEFKIFLFLEEGEDAAGRTFRIGPKARFGSPHVHLSQRAKPGEGIPGNLGIYFNEYAMLIEFGERKGNQLPGRIYLCTPDEGRSFVAGTFVVGAEPESGGKIHGSIRLARPLPRDGNLQITCYGLGPKGKLEGPGGGLPARGPGSVTSLTWKPRNTRLSVDRSGAWTHEHTSRPPGRYLLALSGNRAAHPDGSVTYQGIYDWKWIDLKQEDTTIEVNLTYDPARLGRLEVEVAGAGPDARVSYVPVEPDGRDSLPGLLGYTRFTMGSPVVQGKATVRDLREGSYRIDVSPVEPGADPRRFETTVRIRAGETTRVKLPEG
jgi:hypothetical protein